MNEYVMHIYMSHYSICIKRNYSGILHAFINVRKSNHSDTVSIRHLQIYTHIRVYVELARVEASIQFIQFNGYVNKTG